MSALLPGIEEYMFASEVVVSEPFTRILARFTDGHYERIADAPTNTVARPLVVFLNRYGRDAYRLHCARCGYRNAEPVFGLPPEACPQCGNRGASFSRLDWYLIFP